MKITLLASIFILFGLQAFAQNRTTYNQYIINPGTYNPGYIDINAEAGFSAIYRRQWLQQANGPQSVLANGFYNISRNHGVGVTFSNDGVDKYNQMEAGANYVYHLWHNESLAIGLGAKVNYYQQSYNQSHYTVFDAYDTTLSLGQKLSGVNFGFGVSLTTRNFLFNLGMPGLFANSLGNSEYRYSLKNSHYYLSTGYKFTVNEDLVFYPTIFAKTAIGAPLNYAADLNFILKQKFWLGAGYKSGNSVVATFGMYFENGLRVVYNMESMPISKFTGAGFSHEISIGLGQGFGPLSFGKRHHINKSGRVKGTKKYKIKNSRY